VSCGAAASGGLWGAEFWASSSDGGHNFYLAYRDNPPDGTARAEAGFVDHVDASLTSLDFDPQEPATVGGTCFNAGQPTKKTPCTVILTASLSSLGVKPGAGLYSFTGLSVYVSGQQTQPVPFTNLNLANNEQADAATAFDDNGTGTTP